MADKIIGKSIKRVDALGKVTGKTLYPGDHNRQDELWLKVLFARHPHARVMSIDTGPAKALPGVIDVLTAADVPVNQHGLQVPDQPVLCGPGSDKKGGDVVRFVGDQVAVVIAETEQIAAQARELIKVEYEDLPVVYDTEYGMSGKGPQLHPGVLNNIADYKRIRKGNPDEVWEQCNVIIESLYQTPFQEHAYLQPEAGTAYMDDQGRITVHCAGQWTWEDQQEIAHALDLPPDKIRVVYDAIGGAFGGREDMSGQIILALAVLRTYERYGNQRPMKIIWTREESIIGHCKRHPMTIYAKWGAKNDGTLLAAEMKIISDAGAYMYTSNKVLGNTLMTCTGPYEFPHVNVDAYAVYTNNPPGAFRGFGAPQGHYAAEMQMNKLAEKLGTDPVDVRLKNLLDDDKLLSFGTTMPGGVNLEKVLREAAWHSNWRYPGKRGENNPDYPEDLPRFVKGRSLAVGFKNIGFSFGYQDTSWAKIELRGGQEIEEAILRIAGADVGQGHHTAMVQIAAEVLDVDVDKIQLVVSDTAQTENSGSASASRLTFMAGNAVKEAAEFALRKWRKKEERPAVAEATWIAPKTTPIDPQTGYGVPNFAYGYVAQVAEVTVDTDTGSITVDRVVCVDDVGKAINPGQIVGQIEGAVVQAHGYAVLEDFRVEKGEVLTPHFSTYLIPGVYDIPKRVDSVIVEEPNPDGPFGVRGMAEMPYLPYAALIASAVFDAIGIWFNDFPLTPERVLRGLGKVRSRI